MLSIIVAKAKNNIIGKNNGLLWYLPEDLRRFKEKTTGHVIIMGRKTFESLGRVLPNRKHVVFTQNPDFHVDDENVDVVHSMLEIKQYIDDEEENFVIGGAQIYSILMPKCKKLYVTQVDKDFVGDTYFPVIRENEWEVTEKIEGPKDENDFKYEYITYKRKGNN